MMRTFVESVQEAYPDDEHIFYVTKKIPLSEREFFDDENMIHMEGADRPEKVAHLSKYFDQADAIVWHGFLYPFRMMLFLYGRRQYLRKSIWVMWGIDLYNWKIRGASPKVLFMNHVNRYCRKHVAAVVALLEPDEEVYRRTIRSKTPCFVAPYPISFESFRLMEERRGAACRENGVVRIQIGNNAHSFNNHNRVLDAIAQLDDERAHYYFPLSYGDKKDWRGNKDSYKSELMERALEAYDTRAHFLHKMMPQREYTDFLWSMDIAIFDAERQNALGNMLKLLYMGNKVFLSENNPLYSFFLERGISVESTNSLADMTKEEFYAPTDSGNAVKWIHQTYFPPNAMKKWSGVFNALRPEAPIEAVEYESCGRGVPAHRFERKPNGLRLTPFCRSRLRLPKDWSFVVLFGCGDAFEVVAQSVNDSEPNMYLKGALVDNQTQIEEADRALPDGVETCGVADDVEGLVEGTIVVPTWREGARRRRDFDFIRSARGEVGTVVSCNARIGFDVEMDEGVFVSSGSTVMPFSRLGTGVFVQQAHLGSNVEVGPFCTIRTGVICGDGVIMGEGCDIGMGAIIPENTILPAGTVVPAGVVYGA